MKVCLLNDSFPPAMDGVVNVVLNYADHLRKDHEAEVAVGTPEYPDRSATLIVEMERLQASGARLSGPGIKAAAALSLPEITEFQANARHFPLGLDFLFTCGDRLAALPRSTRVEGR